MMGLQPVTRLRGREEGEPSRINVILTEGDSQCSEPCTLWSTLREDAQASYATRHSGLGYRPSVAPRLLDIFPQREPLGTAV